MKMKFEASFFQIKYTRTLTYTHKNTKLMKLYTRMEEDFY